ncbi:ABC-2 transporter permease [Candidatus Contubernalis alkaliaceticus]|uniref:ABC-2 transporter permease n=1 Tax=Candidatus Contubernalis alkaliaceticus TaxID=338645 RepID=UPI001F4C0C75|nr:ABC-2 transporter permease [Candidatus Contubernalis alkalaceticus]UNC91072.1 ABC-2 transporter permease [Candidatus Contubernalis alkalaceticus]
MLNLVLKDFIVQKNYFLFALGYSFFIFFTFGYKGGPLASAAYIMGTVAIIYMFVQNSCAVDEKNNSEIILLSLPLTRNNIVISKYISSVMFALFTLAVISIVGFGLHTLGVGEILAITILETSAAVLLTSFFIALYLPVFFKLGYHKTRYVSMFMFFFLFFGPSTFISYIIENPEIQWIFNVTEMLVNCPEWYFLTAGLAAAGFLLTLSILLSNKFYKHRTF